MGRKLNAAQVQYATQNSIPFLTVGGSGHGVIESLAKLQNGIQIWTASMNSVTIASDGQSATIGPGALSKQVTDALYAQQKWTGKFRLAVVPDGSLLS
jgi:FAD/FMN-containing dehydrogenase